MALHEVYSGQISAYKAACEEHPELKAFDSSLQEKTKKVLNSIIGQAKTGSYSIITSYAEVYGYLLEAIVDVAKFIIRIEGGVWENEDLRSLAKAYFEDTVKTLEFFNTVDNLVDKASIGDGYIQRAVELFDKESEDKKKKYEKTLEELKKFEEMKEDFDGDKLKAQFDLVKKEQESLLEKVSKLKTKIDEAYAESMILILVTSVFLPCVFIGVALIEVAIYAHNGEALVIGASLLLPFVILGYLPKLEDILKKQEEIAKQVEKGLEVNKDAMATIMSLVENLLEKISSMLEIADFAGELDTKLALQLINKKMSGFTDEINEVGENVAKLKELVTGAIIKVLEKIKGIQFIISNLWKHFLTVYNYFAYREPLYIENAKGLSFSLLIFFATSVGCIVVLVLRRLIIGAELGGPTRLWAWLTSVYFMMLWVVFVVLSSLKVSGII